MTAVPRRWSWWAGAPIRAALIGVIWLYRVSLGPLLGGQCRFYPSCSVYAEAAIRELGWARGFALAIWRIVRCNPFGGGGVDHPPRRRPGVYDVVLSCPYDGVILGPILAPWDDTFDEVEAFHPRGAEAPNRRDSSS